MADIKLTIFNAEINAYASSANATITYLADMGGGALDNPNVMIAAMNLAPKIGSQQEFGTVSGAPNLSNTQFGGNLQPGFVGGGYSTHNLRVSRVRPYVGNTNNSKVLFVDVTYESRPKPTIEIGATAVQERTDTYLQQLQTQAGNFYLKRQQMVIDWISKAGSYYNVNGQKDPPTDVIRPKTPVTASRFRLGSTVRISSTFYNDEMTLFQANALSAVYTTTVNKDDLFYVDPSLLGVGDASSWLVTACGGVSMDGGYTIKAFAEWMFNPYGWDSHAVYTDPFTQQPAILTQDVVDNLWAKSTPQFGKVPPPYNEPYAGAGRFPQQVQYRLLPLVGFVSQGYLGPFGVINSVLSPQF